jgi:phage anti-repressor protein
MDNLVNVTEKDGKQTVSARELHTALEVETRFNDWIKRRIKEYGFIKDEDFYSILSKSTGGRSGTDYLLSTDMAKELAMLENNEKGREVRRYLIKLEEAWNSPETVMQRALQIAGSRDAEIGLYGEAARKLYAAEKRLMKEMPGEKGREKAGKNLAPAAMLYRHAVYNLQTIAVVTAVYYDALRCKMGAIKQICGWTDEAVNKLVFDARDEFGSEWYFEAGDREASKLPGRNAPALDFTSPV